MPCAINDKVGVVAHALMGIALARQRAERLIAVGHAESACRANQVRRRRAQLITIEEGIWQPELLPCLGLLAADAANAGYARGWTRPTRLVDHM